MARYGVIYACIVSIGCLAALPRVAAAADYDRLPAAPQLVLREGELVLLAGVVQREAENQPVAGQKAVAWTAVNRLRAGIYGRTLREVLQARYQYARPKPRRPDSPAYRTALMAALMAVKGVGEDPSRGSTHFHVCRMRPTPRWVRAMERRAIIQSHCFYRLKESKS